MSRQSVEVVVVVVVVVVRSWGCGGKSRSGNSGILKEWRKRLRQVRQVESVSGSMEVSNTGLSKCWKVVSFGGSSWWIIFCAIKLIERAWIIEFKLQFVTRADGARTADARDWYRRILRVLTQGKTPARQTAQVTVIPMI